MKKTQKPNPELHNTAIYVGEDAELRAMAIAFYEENGYKLEKRGNKKKYIGTLSVTHPLGYECCFEFDYALALEFGKKIITLPEIKQPMTSERIQEIQSKTAYPDSISVQQALLKVWNECEQYFNQERTKNEHFTH